jgi:hypothetical protein
MTARVFTADDLRKCAERELALRRAVYLKRGMTPAREREIEMMAAIAAHFAALIADRATKEPEREQA